MQVIDSIRYKKFRGMYFMKERIMKYIVYFLLVIESLLSVLTATILKNIIDVASNKNIYKLKYTAITVLVFLGLLFLISYFSSLFRNKYIYNYNYNSKKNIIETIIDYNYDEFFSKDVGHYLTILEKNTQLYQQYNLEAKFSLVKNIALMVFGLTSMLFYSWELCILILVTAIIPIVVSSILSKPLKGLQKNYQNNYSLYLDNVKSILLSFPIIKLFNAKSYVLDENKCILKDSENSNFKLNFRNDIIQSITSVVGSIVIFVIFISGAYLVINNKIDVGTLIAFIQLTNYVISPIQSISVDVQRIKSTKSIFDDLAFENINHDKSKYTLDTINNISLKNVSLTLNQNEILKNINLSLIKGNKYAIIGPNGSGKSTLLQTINKLHKIDKGEILIDNININTISDSDYFTNLMYLFQHPIIFNRNVKDNILMGAAEDGKLLEKIVSIMELDGILNKDANNLSGGEKQKVALARVLYREPKVLLLDEAYSQIDAKSAARIKDKIFKMNNTLIEVTHDITKSNLQKYSEIILILNGYIFSKGNYNEIEKDINQIMVDK